MIPKSPDRIKSLKYMESLQEMLRDQAWIGDAVLGLFARQWLLANDPPARGLSRQDLYVRLTSNHFLSAFGEPTAVEARIGRLYRDEGMAAAFNWMEAELIPHFLKQLQKMRLGSGKTKG